MKILPLRNNPLYGILNDIFGHRIELVFQEGLVDSIDSGDFQAKLQYLTEKWSNCEMSSSADMAGFMKWFISNKADVIRDTMLCNQLVRNVALEILQKFLPQIQVKV